MCDMTNPNVEKRIRVYIVDDHRVVRAGLKSIFEDYPDIQIIGEAAEADAALREIPGLQPDVVLVDLRLPGQDGCALCRRLKDLPRPPRLLILSSFGGEANLLAAAASGVDGYVLKTSEDDLLVAAINTVMAGGSVWPFLNGTVLPQPGSDQDRLNRLSPQERRVLALLTEGKTNKEIALVFGVSEKTVRNQVSSLMHKLGVERRAQAAAYYSRFSSPGV